MMPPTEARRELPRTHILKLSETGFEQRSERGFGRYTEHEMSLWVVCEATLQASPTLFGQFQKMSVLGRSTRSAGLGSREWLELLLHRRGFDLDEQLRRG